eukprot:9321473-Pyramimonas_sp.AAC.1
MLLLSSLPRRHTENNLESALWQQSGTTLGLSAVLAEDDGHGGGRDHTHLRDDHRDVLRGHHVCRERESQPPPATGGSVYDPTATVGSVYDPTATDGSVYVDPSERSEHETAGADDFRG